MFPAQRVWPTSAARVTPFDYGDRVGQGGDDTVAINAALGALAAAGGGVMDLPPITYNLLSGGIVIPADNIIIRGWGYGTVLRPGAGTSFDVISTPIPGIVGTAGFIRNYVGIEALKIDCGLMAGTVAGQGNGIHTYGTRYSYIRNVSVVSSKNWAILLDGDNSGAQNFGYDNRVDGCIFDLCNGNIYTNNCEANDFTGNRYKWCGSAAAALQPVFGTQDTVTMHLRLASGYMYVAGNVFGKGGTYSTPAIRAENSGPCRIIGNRFDQVRAQAAVLNAGNHELIGNALGSPGSAATGVPGIQLGSSNNRVIGNSYDTTAGGSSYTFAVAEAGGPFTGNIIADNLLIAGTSGLISLNATSTTKTHHNFPYNPLGHAMTQPAVPASTTPITNTFGVDAEVHIAGGTVTVIAVGGVATGLTAGTVRVPVGQTITLTYSVAPTWQWFGD